MPDDPSFPAEFEEVGEDCLLASLNQRFREKRVHARSDFFRR